VPAEHFHHALVGLAAGQGGHSGGKIEISLSTPSFQPFSDFVVMATALGPGWATPWRGSPAVLAGAPGRRWDR
jgi:hypothetical protein